MTQLSIRDSAIENPLHIVGIGGTTRPGSSSEQALRTAIGRAAQIGATTRVFGGHELATLPLYDPAAKDAHSVSRELTRHLRRANGVIVASPGYHGSVSGLVKNALDYAEELHADEVPYLAGRAVGLIVTAYGWQASVSTLTTLRTIVPALRGWVTPFGACINSAESRFVDGTCDDRDVTRKLEQVADDVLWFAAAARAQTAFGNADSACDPVGLG